MPLAPPDPKRTTNISRTYAERPLFLTNQERCLVRNYNPTSGSTGMLDMAVAIKPSTY